MRITPIFFLLSITYPFSFAVSKSRIAFVGPPVDSATTRPTQRNTDAWSEANQTNRQHFQKRKSSCLFLEFPHMNHHQHQRTGQSGNADGKKSSTELSFLSSQGLSLDLQSSTDLRVYCDMDGVLVDFSKGVQQLVGRSPSEFNNKNSMWDEIARADSFFENLEWTPDGQELWKAIRKLNPDILTGVAHKSSRLEKFNWCRRELGPMLDRPLNHVDVTADDNHEYVDGKTPTPDACNVITCWSNFKYREITAANTATAVLIDDRDSLRQNWEGAGGIFIHHTDAETTIQRLVDHGLLIGNDMVDDA